MDNLKDQWEEKQKEVEAKFLELEEEAAIQGSLPKKRKRGKKTVPQQQQTDAFAKYAAELQIEMFVKVS